LKLYVDEGARDKWSLVVDAEENGRGLLGPAIRIAGHAGIATEFVDGEIRSYEAEAVG
jgi:hypothetical protein